METETKNGHEREASITNPGYAKRLRSKRKASIYSLGFPKASQHTQRAVIEATWGFCRTPTGLSTLFRLTLHLLFRDPVQNHNIPSSLWEKIYPALLFPRWYLVNGIN